MRLDHVLVTDHFDVLEVRLGEAGRQRSPSRGGIELTASFQRTIVIPGRSEPGRTPRQDAAVPLRTKRWSSHAPVRTWGSRQDWRAASASTRTTEWAGRIKPAGMVMSPASSRPSGSDFDAPLISQTTILARSSTGLVSETRRDCRCRLGRSRPTVVPAARLTSGSPGNERSGVSVVAEAEVDQIQDRRITGQLDQFGSRTRASTSAATSDRAGPPIERSSAGTVEQLVDRQRAASSPRGR